MGARKGNGEDKPQPPPTVLEPGATPSREAGTPADDATVLQTPPDRTLVSREEIAAAEEGVAADWSEGDVILDLYEVKDLLGEGGMGKVYRVHHRGWNLDLAVKSPRVDYFRTEEQKANFVRECETWIDLGLHPHTVSCHYVRTLGDVPRVFAECVEGGSLADWIRTRKLYEGGHEKARQRMLDLAIQLAWGLGHAHRKKVIHQDVKPANVLITPDGVAKVTDFGLARARTAGKAEIADDRGGTVVVDGAGMTPEYCSPEQAAGERLTRRTDIWSWGLCVLEMFAGERTWRSGLAAPEALQSYLETGPADEPIPPMATGDGEGAKRGTLRGLLQRCFQLDPDERPKNMAEVVAKLREVYHEATRERYARPEPKAAELLADALNNRAVSLLDLGRGEEAEERFEQALKSDPHHAEATYNRGLVLWRSGRLADDTFVTLLEEVRKSHASDWRDEYYLGLVHMERGDADAAVEVLEEAARAAPEEDEVRNALSTAKNGIGDWRSCVRVSEDAVIDVAISADGRWGVASQDKKLRLWELAKRQCVRVLEGHKEKDLSVAISADRRWALSGSGSLLEESKDPTLRLWELATGKCVRVFEGHLEAVSDVAISADGRWGVSASKDRKLRLWELATGECARVFEGHTKYVQDVSMTPDGRWGLSASMDKTLRLWRLVPEKGARKLVRKSVRVLRGHRASVQSAAISPDGRWGLSGSVDRTLRLWDLTTGKCARLLEGHRSWVDYVAMSSDVRRALSRDRGGVLRLWDLLTGRCVRSFEAHGSSDSGGCMAMCPDGRWALTGSEDGLRLWELQAAGAAAPFVVTRPRTAGEVRGVAVQAAAAMDKARRLLRRGRPLEAAGALAEVRRLPGYERHPDALEMSRQAGLCGRRIRLSQAWCAATLEGHEAAVTSVAITPDGSQALSGSVDETLRVWELATGDCVSVRDERIFKKQTGKTVPVTSVAISPDGQKGLVAQRTSASLYSLRSGKLLKGLTQKKRLDPEHPERPLTSVAIHSDGRLALAGGTDGKARLWGLTTGKTWPLPLRVLEGRRGSVPSVAISADGLWGLSGSHDKTLRLWELATGKCVRVLEGHDFWVKSVAISADGRWGISGSYDETLRLWNLATGECIRTLEGHTKGVEAAAFSPDGRWVLSGSEDGTARLWSLATGECEWVFEGHTEGVNTVAFSPDGRWGISGSQDKTLRLWELTWEYEFPDPADWDEAARPYLDVFLTLHCPYGEDGISRAGIPEWKKKDFEKHLSELQQRGYGWLRPDGVRRELQKAVGERKADEAARADEALQRARALLGEERNREAAEVLTEVRHLSGHERHPEVLESLRSAGLRGERVSLADGWCARSLGGHTEAVSTVAVSPDGRRGISGSRDRTLRLWDLTEGKCVQVLDALAGTPRSVAINQDGRKAVAASGNGLLLLDPDSGARERWLEAHEDEILSVALSADGCSALSASRDETLRLSELATAKCVRIFKGHSSAITCVALSPEGQRALSGSDDKTLRLWNLPTGECLRVFEGHESSIESVAIGPGGRRALSASQDWTLRLWDLATGECTRVFERHTGSVNTVVVSPDGRAALSGSEDKTIRIWPLTLKALTQKDPSRVFKGHRGAVRSVALSSECCRALSGGDDKSVRLWDFVWDYAFPDTKGWSDLARPHLVRFLAMCPAPRRGLTRRRTPSWTERDFERLVVDLQRCGFGWLRPEGVRRELEKMTRNWKGPPPLRRA